MLQLQFLGMATSPYRPGTAKNGAAVGPTTAFADPEYVIVSLPPSILRLGRGFGHCGVMGKDVQYTVPYNPVSSRPPSRFPNLRKDTDSREQAELTKPFLFCRSQGESQGIIASRSGT